VLDELGYLPFSQVGGALLFHLLSKLYEHTSAPSTMAYKGFPVDKVRQHRGKYVAAVLTIIQAWRKAGLHRAAADSIVTFGGAWSDYCRYPLMWLGHPDPATALLEQVKHDPDGDLLISTEF
jgi:hypothetical protein